MGMFTEAADELEDAKNQILEQQAMNLKTDANTVLGKAMEQVINYIENEAEIAMPADELMHESGRHLTKKEYGHVLLKYLVIELRNQFTQK